MRLQHLGICVGVGLQCFPLQEGLKRKRRESARESVGERDEGGWQRKCNEKK